MLFILLAIGGLLCQSSSTNTARHAVVKVVPNRSCNGSEAMQGVYATFAETKKVSGFLVKANPYHACRPLENFSRIPHFARMLQGRITLLVDYGQCDYAQKMKNARLARASTVILKNRNSDLKQMTADDDLKIVAVMVSEKSGQELERRLRDCRLVNVTISPTEAEIEDEVQGLINEKAFTVICVAFGLVIALSLFGLSFFYVQRCRLLEAERRHQKRLKRKALKAVNRLPTRICKGRGTAGSKISTYNDAMSTSSGIGSCVICLDEFSRGDLLRTLPCSHEFHKACIDPWLVDKQTCPMCKLDILKSLALPRAWPPETSEACVPSPRHTLFSDELAQDAEAVELRSNWSGSEQQDHTDGGNGLSEEASSLAMSQIVTTVQVMALSDHTAENMSDNEVTHYTVCDIESDPTELPEMVSSGSASSNEENKLQHCSSSNTFCQTSNYQYDSRDCLI